MLSSVNLDDAARSSVGYFKTKMGLNNENSTTFNFFKTFVNNVPNKKGNDNFLTKQSFHQNIAFNSGPDKRSTGKLLYTEDRVWG